MRALQHSSASFSPSKLSIGEVEAPKIHDDLDLIIEVNSVALNPVDLLMLDLGLFVKEWPAVVGCDVAGTVKSVGSKVKRFAPGDEVFAYVPVGQGGAFSELCRTQEPFVMKKPSSASFEGTCGLPTALFTSALGLKNLTVLPSSSSSPKGLILIWGGSSSVGSAAIQLARSLGLEVITTSSLRNADMVKSLGAQHVVDHASPDVVDQIKTIVDKSGKHLHLFLDAIGGETTNLGLQCLDPTAPAWVTSVSVTWNDPVPSNVTYEAIKLGFFKAQDDPEFFTMVAKLAEDLVAHDKLKAPSVEKLPEGLKGISQGLEAFKLKKVSGKKMVAVLAETPK